VANTLLIPVTSERQLRPS